MFSTEILKQVVKEAREDAVLFFSEFQSVCRGEETDWGAVSWGEFDCSEIQELGQNPDDYFNIYSSKLETETTKMFRAFRDSFEVTANRWQSKVIDWEEIHVCAGDTRLWPVIQINAQDLSEWEEVENEDGSTSDLDDEFPTEAEILNRLPRLEDGFTYQMGEWSGGTDDWVVAFVSVVQRPVSTAIAYQVARDCGLEVVVA